MGRLFGTDGVRGLANTELDCETALKIGRAAAEVLGGTSRRRPLFVLGSDTRASSDMLSMAAMAGICSMGADVISLGVVPTPAVAYLVGKYKADAGIMISASHNPAEFNGIKIFSGDGYKLPDELEERIETIVLDRGAPPEMPSGDAVGRLTLAPQAARDYIEHVKSGRKLYIPNSYIKNETECRDYTDYLLPVKAGDTLSVIFQCSKGCIVKNNGVIGWYRGKYSV